MSNCPHLDLSNLMGKLLCDIQKSRLPDTIIEQDMAYMCRLVLVAHLDRVHPIQLPDQASTYWFHIRKDIPYSEQASWCLRL